MVDGRRPSSPAGEDGHRPSIAMAGVFSSSSSSRSSSSESLSLNPPSRRSSDQPSNRFPLSLQDTCILNILLRVEDFPIQSLAHLPRGIRKRLFIGLSHADILHVDGALLFNGLTIEFDHSRGGHDQRGPTIAREELLDVIL